MDGQRGNWSSNMGLILAATGSAIGLAISGNFPLSPGKTVAGPLSWAI
ncbi:MAG: hypothetical protein Ct9H300mP15_17040 [Gemmatimonadota bacterium]|nr:MAG: hypothetical protein Ct9H300mP15_17040 [Gemmatimonadota bacterium]